MINKKVETNKIFFRKIILLMVFTVILTGLIPSVFDFEKYYGISRFINPGYTSVLLEGKFELYATIFMSFFSLISLILIYFFIPIGKYFFLIHFCANFFLIMLSLIALSGFLVVTYLDIPAPDKLKTKILDVNDEKIK